jgi:alpha-ketoglutarate-dependent 2,4-dichlorophenoxyacetate dioxygenase
MHRATGGTYPGKYLRDMRRATVHDSSPTAWGLNEVTTERAGLFAQEMKSNENGVKA